MSAAPLIVSINGTEIGTLTKTRKGARFAFNEDCCNQYSGRPLLSASLLVKSRPYAEGLTNAWFSGLLPEGNRLDRISRELGCPATDYVAILREYGWECAGAVNLVPEGFRAPNEQTTEALTEADLRSLLTDLPEYALQVNRPVRLSLGGFQEKACLCGSSVSVAAGYIEAGHFAIPGPQTVSTHIFKPQPASQYPHLVEGEAWALHAASFAARSAEAALLQLDEAPVTLVVKRFDRHEANGIVRRLHQEDCCQALGLSPANKYASHAQEKGDNPSYKNIAALFQRFASDPIEEKLELLRQMCVNLALGNTDAHAKNYSFLYKTECLPSLSPMYDLVPVVDIEPAADTLSLRINHQTRLQDVQLEDLVLEAEGWGIAAGEAERVIQETLHALGEGIHAASLLYPNAGKRHADATTARIQAILQG